MGFSFRGNGDCLIVIVDVSADDISTVVVSIVSAAVPVAAFVDVISVAVTDVALFAIVLTECFFFLVTWIHPSPELF